MASKTNKNTVPSNDFSAMSDAAAMSVIGAFVRENRIRQNKTQQEIADAAGINRGTLIQLETGGAVKLSTFIEVLRVLGLLNVIKHFTIADEISPLKLAKLQAQKRQRATSRAIIAKRTKSKTDTDW